MDELYAYLAGYLDADGCITIVVNATQLRIEVLSNFELVPKLYLDTFGGSLYEIKGRYKWEGHSTDVNTKVIDCLLPHIRLKKAQMLLGQQWLSYSRGRGNKLTEQERLERAILQIQIHRLNGTEI